MIGLGQGGGIRFWPGGMHLEFRWSFWEEVFSSYLLEKATLSGDPTATSCIRQFAPGLLYR